MATPHISGSPMSILCSVPLTDAVVVAVSQLVDDAQSAERRDPSHADLKFLFERYGLLDGDPCARGQTAGKAKRVKSVLTWAIEAAPEQGSRFVSALISEIRGHGGFRESSANFVGEHKYANLAAILVSEGYELSRDGELRARLLDSFSVTLAVDAINIYVRRAKRGVDDAALVTSTGKDLLEATAGYIVQKRYGNYNTTSNFPTLLGQAFDARGLATSHHPVVSGEPPEKRIERALYELACGVNQLRNKQGVGHGRPWLPTVTSTDARMATELMGIIAERLLR